MRLLNNGGRCIAVRARDARNLMSYALVFAAVVLNVAAYAIFRSIAQRPHDGAWALLFSSGLLLGGANLFRFTAALEKLRLAVAYLSRLLWRNNRAHGYHLCAGLR